MIRTYSDPADRACIFNSYVKCHRHKLPGLRLQRLLSLKYTIIYYSWQTIFLLWLHSQFQKKHWSPCRFSASGTPSISFTAWNNRSLFFHTPTSPLEKFLTHAQFIERWSADICYLTLWWTVWFWRREECNVSLWNSESGPKESNNASQNVKRRMTYWLILSLFGCSFLYC